jgi:hypothetical protein
MTFLCTSRRYVMADSIHYRKGSRFSMNWLRIGAAGCPPAISNWMESLLKRRSQGRGAISVIAVAKIIVVHAAIMVIDDRVVISVIVVAIMIAARAATMRIVRHAVILAIVAAMTIVAHAAILVTVHPAVIPVIA